jgi:hypothetical protein
MGTYGMTSGPHKNCLEIFYHLVEKCIFLGIIYFLKQKLDEIIWVFVGHYPKEHFRFHQNTEDKIKQRLGAVLLEYILQKFWALSRHYHLFQILRRNP